MSRLLLKRLLVAVLMLCLLAGGAVVFRAPLLRECANLWIVDQPVTTADAIVILGGGPENRPYAAARLFHQGVAPKILVMNVRPSPAVEKGILPSEQELTCRELLSEGVAETNLVKLDRQVSTSYDESLAVRDWVKQTGAKQIVIVTDPFHTRRISWLYGRELSGVDVKALVSSAPVSQYTATNWWLHEEGLIGFQNEIVKSAYYRMKY